MGVVVTARIRAMVMGERISRVARSARIMIDMLAKTNNNVNNGFIDVFLLIGYLLQLPHLLYRCP